MSKPSSVYAARLRPVLIIALALIQLGLNPGGPPARAASDGVIPAAGDIIINEYVADNDPNNNDFIELLTLKDNLDLRSLRISDNELLTGTLNTSENVMVFANAAYLNNIPAGTTIAIWTAPIGVTTDTVVNAAASDWSMVLARDNGVTFGSDGLGGSVTAGLSTAGEALYLYLPGPNGDSAGTDNVYLDFVSFEADGGDVPSGLTDLNLPALADNAYFTASNASANDVAANWVTYDFPAVAPNLPTPGQANPSQNLSSLRIAPPDAAPAVASTVPLTNAINVATTSNLEIAFSEPVTLGSDWLRVTCDDSGTRSTSALSITGGPSIYAANPITDFINNELCVATVFADSVLDQDLAPTPMAADYSFNFMIGPSPAEICSQPFTRTFEVQGAGATSPLSGTAVTVQGVVVGDYEVPAGGVASDHLRGFYLQDPTGDGITATSDGLFVFNGSNDAVSAGQLVRVAGQVQEFQGQTQLGGATSLTVCGPGAVITPTAVSLPFASTTDPERFEGMLVRTPQTLYVTEHFQLGRFGELLLSANARQPIPTHLAAPGGPADAIAQANALSRILIDDASQKQNPDPIVFGGGVLPLSVTNTLRGGDSASGIVGVLGYTWAGNSASPNAYRLRPTRPVTFTSVNPRPAAPQAIAGTLKIAGANMLNLFNTFDGRPDTVDNCAFGVGGLPSDCRGADDAPEFTRQISKTVAVLIGSGADVIGINEIENDGYGADSTIQALVNALNDLSAPGTYAFIDADAGTGVTNALGSDAIKVGLIYKPARVSPVSDTATLRIGAFGPLTLTAGSPQQRNRPALAQTFEDKGSGEKLTVVVNHLKSKGSSCTDQAAPYGPDPDLNDGQGNCNLTRKKAAEELAAWLATKPTGSADPDVLIMGDLNAYAKEDPITALKTAGFVNLVETRLGAGAYSYVFGGQWGYLDHALASASLNAQVAGVTEWHINADEPPVLDYNTDFKSAGQLVSLYAPTAIRASDHDPIIVGVALSKTPYRMLLPLTRRAP